MKDKFNWTVRDMEREGYGNNSAVVRKLALLTLPEEVQQFLVSQDTRITEKHCRYITQLCKPNDLKKLFKEYASYFEDWEEEAQKEIKERIAKAVGENRARITERINWYINVPDKIKVMFDQSNITEKHLRRITSLEVGRTFSSWLTTEQLWIDIANWVVEKGKWIYFI